MYNSASFAKNTLKNVFFEGVMQENGEYSEFLQKYCSALGGYVTMVADKNGQNCLSAHLCHGEKCKICNQNAFLHRQSAKGIYINEK